MFFNKENIHLFFSGLCLGIVISTSIAIFNSFDRTSFELIENLNTNHWIAIVAIFINVVIASTAYLTYQQTLKHKKHDAEQKRLAAISLLAIDASQIIDYCNECIEISYEFFTLLKEIEDKTAFHEDIESSRIKLNKIIELIELPKLSDNLVNRMANYAAQDIKSKETRELLNGYQIQKSRLKGSLIYLKHKEKRYTPVLIESYDFVEHMRYAMRLYLMTEDFFSHARNNTEFDENEIHEADINFRLYAKLGVNLPKDEDVIR